MYHLSTASLHVVNSHARTRIGKGGVLYLLFWPPFNCSSIKVMHKDFCPSAASRIWDIGIFQQCKHWWCTNFYRMFWLTSLLVCKQARHSIMWEFLKCVSQHLWFTCHFERETTEHNGIFFPQVKAFFVGVGHPFTFLISEIFLHKGTESKANSSALWDKYVSQTGACSSASSELACSDSSSG